MKISHRSLLFYAVFLAILSLGFWLRVSNINERPMHGDEANQAYQFQTLVEKGSYKYEPRDFHGPTLYYLTLPFYKIAGPATFSEAQKWHFRGVTVLFSLLTALAVLLFMDVLGKAGVLTLTLFQMISPSMVYYSTYFIQETLLVCFITFFCGCLWRLWRRPSLLWSIGAGASLGLLHATKETFVLSLGALAFVGLIGCVLFDRGDFKKFNKQHILSLSFSALFISVLFYSSFFSNPSGPIDSLTSFVSHVERGLGGDDFPENMTSGAGHTKPFTYYLDNIIGYYPRKLSSTAKDIFRNSPARPITEIFFLLASFGGLFYLGKSSRSQRFHIYTLSYTLALTLAYSLIPYKTPWCMLSFHFGLMFCSAMTVKRVLRSKKLYFKWTLLLIGGIFMLDLVRQSMLINSEEFCTSDRNQFAYVQAGYDLEDLSVRIIEMSKIDGRLDEMPIHFFTPEYWPLPWYLKQFSKVGYHEHDMPKNDIKSLPIIVSTPDRQDVASILSQTHIAESRGRLPGYFLTVYYRKDLWQRFMSIKN